ncbi:MAG: hypothetical protein NT037_17355 [Hyphomicrobiales bacterium]|jgi:hypothetical protein|nr:hypothetical protein [Hyphomicrobiales bacterium]
MLRVKFCASLMSLSIAAILAEAATPAAAQPGLRAKGFSAQGVPPPPVAVRLPGRPVRPIIQNAYLGSVLPFYGYAYGQTVIIERNAPAPAAMQLTINTIPTVVGIRRAPEAQPLIYRIGDRGGPRLVNRGMRERWLAEHSRMRQARSGSAAPDTSGARIIIVR